MKFFVRKYTGKRRESQLKVALSRFFCILASTQQKVGVRGIRPCEENPFSSVWRLYPAVRSRVAATATQGLQRMATNTGETANSIVTVEQEITPEHLRCASGFCPAVHRASDGDLVIIGKIPSEEILNQMAMKIGQDEFIIKINPEFFRKIF